MGEDGLYGYFQRTTGDLGILDQHGSADGKERIDEDVGELLHTRHIEGFSCTLWLSSTLFPYLCVAG